MKWIIASVFVLLVAAFQAGAQRPERDISLHLGGGHHHDDHHGHGVKQVGASASASAVVETRKGYGKDIPQPPLAIDLKPLEKEEPVKEKEQQPSLEYLPPVVEAVKEETPKGYPRENPPNPLKLDPQAATKVEVRVDSSTVAPMMMMGGEIPGNAGTDYPIFDTIPETKFNCNDQPTGGYYADVDEGRCQVFHVCHDGRKFSFLCPNGTIFDQKVFVCNWYFNVDCAASKDFYDLNAQIGVVPDKAEKSPVEQLAVAPSVVDTQQVDSPNQNYLPPTPAKETVKVEPPTSSYLPPNVAPNAVEALSNGIITADPPAQSYLPPQ
ncbi:uncharacterized protein LOC124348638 [Daphnia pulicaria]|uniref:uncharacterized protein LOC124348638 n=1 Tax=Daphnia pulicaria TaxID=35523 RepID=UPI001EEA00DE|nr:uncharacterized protein LOC124348638 [Daphnia pulicaria]